ncbi:MAG: Na(+)/H(+) antiporter NhaA [Steroidobacteraceae bacterium]|nr:Na(+)/H(+) antiporter NhaA [Steroidobacteraceae bacterium]
MTTSGAVHSHAGPGQQWRLPAGLLMLAMAAIAIAWANSPWAGVHRQLMALPMAMRVGPIGIEKPLVLLVNDGLMAIFFLLVGVEVKRELAHGSLSSVRQALLPAFAAVGGMLLPALIFTAFNAGDPLALRGWAIPCATDIAFSLVVLRLAAPRAPPALYAFLAAVAVIDDLGAIVIIALFYTSQLSPEMLLAALAPLTVLLLLNRRGVRQVAPYMLAGLVLWFCVLKSGVHATLAGVITALALPVSRARRDSPADRTEAALDPWVYFGVLPLFALLNAGVDLRGLSLHDLVAPVPLGVGVGLVAGKLAGIVLGTAAGRLVAGARLPERTTWPQIVALALVAGIGFTMSIFIASLAFEGVVPEHYNGAKLGILFGSLLAAGAGALTLRTVARGRETP